MQRRTRSTLSSFSPLSSFLSSFSCSSRSLSSRSPPRLYFGFSYRGSSFSSGFFNISPCCFFLLKHLSTLHRFHPLHPCSRRFAAAVFSVARSLYRATDPPVRDLSSALRNPRLEAEQFMESDKLAKVKMIRLGHIFRPGSVIRLKGEIRVGLATSNDASFVPCVHWFG